MQDLPVTNAEAPPAALPPIVVITGLSGSGKSTALDVFEDMGFYRIDGIPSFLLPDILKLYKNPDFAGSTGIVLGVDLRNALSIASLENSLQQMGKAGAKPSILFFEAKTGVLVTRYAATRRPHPLEKEGLGLEQAMQMEKQRLTSLRQMADLVLDTSHYSIHDLRRTLQKKWQAIKPRHETEQGPTLRTHLLSFGFKYGTPAEADIVLDLRYLPNPYFIEELRPLSGQNPAVANFVLHSEQGRESLERIQNFLSFLLAQNEREGRFRLTIAVGCTGGRHRSVAFAEALSAHIATLGYSVSLEHRHLQLG